jgi:hypothetical protein
MPRVAEANVGDDPVTGRRGPATDRRWLLDVLRARGVPGAPGDWSEAIRLADDEGLAAALAHALRGRGWPGVPDEARARLHRALTRALARHVIMTRDLALVLDALAAAGVESMPLKGPVLAETVYPHPATRTFTDLDLLVRPEALERTDLVLEQLGWRPVEGDHSWAFDVAYDGETTYEAPGRATIDLHWRLLNAARYPWNRRATDEAWRRAMPVTVAGRRCRTLAPADLLVYLAAHLAVQHAGVGLRWHLDLARLVDRGEIEWDEVVRRAHEWRMARATAFALGCAQATAGLQLPRGVMRALTGRGPRAACSAAVRHLPDGARHRCEHAMPFLLADRARDLFAAVREVFLPSRAWVTARYPGGAGGTAVRYAAHYRRLLTVVRTAVGAGR